MSTCHLKPLLPYKVHIDGTTPYRTFFKKNPKLIGILEVELITLDSSNMDGKKIKQALIKANKKSKYIQGLRLHRCELKSTTRNDSKIKEMSKSFRNIRSLSLSLNGLCSNLLRGYTKWLADSKRLTKLNFVLRTYIQQIVALDDPTAHINRFLQTLKKKKLRVLKVFLEANYNEKFKPFICLNKYPSTPKKFTVNWKAYGVLNSLPSLTQAESSLNHMDSLEVLNLSVPFSRSILSDSLSSLKNPSSIGIGDLEIYSCLDSPTNTLPLESYLGRFNHLTDLTLRVSVNHDYFSSLPNTLKSLPLIKLKFETLVQEARDLVLIGNCFDSLLDLESLILRVRTSEAVDFESQDYFPSFSEHLGNLTQLTKLKVHFMLLHQGMGKKNAGAMKKSCSIIPCLGGCVEKMKKLKELSFRFRNAKFSGYSQCLFKALKNNASEFKKLRINFSGDKLGTKEMEQLSELMQHTKYLEKLALDEINFNNLQGIADIIGGLGHIRSLKFGHTYGVTQLEGLAKFLKKMLEKKHLKKFSFTSKSVPDGDIQFEDRIDLRKITKMNPELQNLFVPFDIFQGEEDLLICKWY